MPRHRLDAPIKALTEESRRKSATELLAMPGVDAALLEAAPKEVLLDLLLRLKTELEHPNIGTFIMSEEKEQERIRVLTEEKFNETIAAARYEAFVGFLNLVEERLGTREADLVLAKVFDRGRRIPPAFDAESWKKIIIGGRLTGETPAQKSARIRRAQRILRDEEQAAELAALVRQGHTTEGARQKMGIGVVRAQRIRAVAVRLGLLEGRRKTVPTGS